MMPIGPLMVEHRLIERMIGLLEERSGEAVRCGEIDPVFIDRAVDFIRTYADRTHHGKEEGILFKDLAIKDLSEEDRRTMQELVDEHVYARSTVGELVGANERYRRGDIAALAIILDKIAALVSLYPGHIAKEDKVFFPAAIKYLDRSEQDAMLQAMWEFDRGMIHEKYRSVVEQLERREVSNE
ncbi:MAG: hemerythrin domain-containing protein [Anaerolineae bacterium]|nr:hemerythrin domain-containing protein [Anaerolineae bacterium]